MPASRAPRHRHDRSHVDLGVEPPIRADGDDVGDHDAAPVSLRWLAGTVLTAVAGLGLMGGAVYAALDGTMHLAGTPDALMRDVARFAAGDRRPSNVARKSDRMSATPETWEARQLVKLTSANRIGDREVLRIRSVTRVVSRLATSTTSRIDHIPAFNAASLMSEQASARMDTGAPDDGDVSYVIRDLKSIRFTSGDGPVPEAEDVLASIRDTATQASRPTIQLTALPGGGEDGQEGARTFSNPGLSHAETTMIVAKRTVMAEAKADKNLLSIDVDAPQRLEAVLQRQGAAAGDARAIAQAFGGSGGYGTVVLSQGQRVEILMSDAANPSPRPARVRLFTDGSLQSAVALSDRGDYVAVAVNASAEVGPEADAPDDSGGSTARLYESLYETALRYDVPDKVTQELVRVFGNDVDFQRRVRAGDGIELVFAEPEVAADMPEILYTAISFGGETHRYYRFPGLDGEPDYFDENGRSVRKFLTRKPLTGGIMRSPFGTRNHPILRYAKMHTGVDWAAPRGTPIYATGSGTVLKAEWDGGYGRYVKIKHSNGYETAYGHMNAFAKGIEGGTRVKQGQLIGYVGSTGLSTGPHVHYEVLVNGRFVDPMRIRVPREQELSGETLAAFHRERQRIEALMQPAGGGERLAGYQTP